MPLEGLVAYWLSLKKLWDERRDKGVLLAEARYTPERSIRLLLELACSGLDEPRMTRAALAAKRVRLGELRRALACMRLAARAVAEGDSPRMTLIRMLGRFPAPPIAESKAGELAQEMLRSVAPRSAPSQDDAALLAVDHKLKPDRLLVKLHFLVMLARRDGKEALRDRLPYMRNPVLAEGMALAADGFDAAFIRRQTQRLAAETLAGLALKLDLSLDMALGLKAGLSYEDLSLAARAYIL